MLTITPDLLMASTGCTHDVAVRFAEPLTDACRKWGIDTPARAAAFVAQNAYETRGFTVLEENLDYRTEAALIRMWPNRFRLPEHHDELGVWIFPSDRKRNATLYLRQPMALAEYAYGGRLGNAEEGSGDGWNFRGRGFPQITGKFNYADYQGATGVPVVSQPALLADPRIACDAGGFFWAGHNLNAYADSKDWEAMTRHIAGSLAGYEDGDEIGLNDRHELLVAANHAMSQEALCVS